MMILTTKEKENMGVCTTAGYATVSYSKRTVNNGAITL
jgi:hypothetical protein